MVHIALANFLPLAFLLPFTLAASPTPPCRFASQWTPERILASPQSFEDDLLYWEGKFHQHNVSYNTVNGMTFDGTLLDMTTGLYRVEGLHTFSAASKESLHFMILAHVIEGKPGAVRWILSGLGDDDAGDTEKARTVALAILQKKWESYNQFNKTFPGFGGFLPWFAHSEFTPLIPTWDWNNRVPALDNGENIWGIYATIEALQNVGKKEYTDLAAKWEGYLDYLKITAAKGHPVGDMKIFYHGSGRICAVTAIGNQSLPIDHPDQSYICEGLDSGGNPFMFFLYLFGNLNQTAKNALLEFKRPQLVSIDWSVPGYENVTVQKGFWFSAHENWGWMQLPYIDVPLMNDVNAFKDLYINMEHARTCDSQAKGLPGMFASINNSTDQNGEIIGLITPYSTMNTMVVNKIVGYLWWHNMARAKRMQNLYGSSESTRIDGTATSAFVSGDSKITTVNGILGGVILLVRTRMQREGVYDEFTRVVSNEYKRVFDRPLNGQTQDFCLPEAEVTDTGLVDFTICTL
ncbi:hypothetical protein AN958_01243 [Leucoagaricus sp. SymC.cos]|nr:hypothetical protein AN958_01243 [Leucoagaricus sp. SymC.cos]